MTITVQAQCVIHSMLYPGSSIKIGLWVILLFIGDHYIFSPNPRRIEWNDFWLQIFLYRVEVTISYLQISYIIISLLIKLKWFIGVLIIYNF